jgi:hypothetical protein
MVLIYCLIGKRIFILQSVMVSFMSVPQAYIPEVIPTKKCHKDGCYYQWLQRGSRLYE